MNLTELTDKVTNILIDAPASVTDEIHSELDAAQREAEDRYAFKVMYENAIAVYNASVKTFDKPSDWLRSQNMNMPYWLYSVDGRTTVKFLSWTPTFEDYGKVYTDILEDGPPKTLIEIETLIAIAPVPDDTYPVFIPYIKRLAVPSTSPSTDTWFMDTAWRYLVFKASSECLSLNRDHEESTLYALKAEREFKRLMNQDKRSRFTGDTLPIQRDAGAPFNQRLR